MDDWGLPIALAVLCLSCFAMGLWGAESRPGFVDGRYDRKERWFPHSRSDN
jgi:hypothetical protein